MLSLHPTTPPVSLLRVLANKSLKVKYLNTCCVSHADPREQELENQVAQHLLCLSRTSQGTKD